MASYRFPGQVLIHRTKNGLGPIRDLFNRPRALKLGICVLSPEGKGTPYFMRGPAGCGPNPLYHERCSESVGHDFLGEKVTRQKFNIVFRKGVL